jgi:hypothetical protein
MPVIIFDPAGSFQSRLLGSFPLADQPGLICYLPKEQVAVVFTYNSALI